MPGKTFSAAEIAKHTEEEDCWLVIHGKVYDVTKYLDEHPGGPEIMVSNAGAEAGEE
jgi:cytochrome b involved in lipid metabolism